MASVHPYCFNLSFSLLKVISGEEWDAQFITNKFMLTAIILLGEGETTYFPGATWPIVLYNILCSTLFCNTNCVCSQHYVFIQQYFDIFVSGKPTKKYLESLRLSLVHIISNVKSHQPQHFHFHFGFFFIHYLISQKIISTNS